MARRYKRKKSQFLEDGFHSKILESLGHLKKYFVFDLPYNRGVIQTLRAIYMQKQGMAIMEDIEAGFYFENYDPTPENSFERACSGMMVYHVNPTTQYFKLSQPAYLDILRKDTPTDLSKELGNRTRMIHAVKQEVSNFQTVARVNRDKMWCGLGCKVIEPDPYRIAELTYIPPEDIALGTSNGKHLDIQGIRENLTAFEARERFENPLKKNFWKDHQVGGLHDEKMMCCYRMNVPLNNYRR